VERARRAVELSKAAGIAPFGSFILGLPGETRETMEETVSFAQSLGIPHGFHLLSPFPGTRVREKAAEYGIKILTDDWSLYDADHAVTETEALKATEVEALAKNFFVTLGAEIERMKKGTLTGTYTGPYREEMEKRIEVDFAWKLLSGDLIEEEGAIPEAEVPLRDDRPQPLEPLGRRIASAVAMPQDFVEKILRKWVAKELIVCRKDDLHRWVGGNRVRLISFKILFHKNRTAYAPRLSRAGDADRVGSHRSRPPAHGAPGAHITPP
jgi:hypothetical protein